MRKKIIFLLFIICSHALNANKPHIINLFREYYHADNKNWDIGQDNKGTIYFGNDKGLLQFDGIEWHLNKLPNASILRSLAVYSHNTIFTGGYEEFGRWDRDISGKLIYTSLSQKIDRSLFKNDDFWKIWIDSSAVYFQSFNSIYVYDYKTVKKIPFEGGFLFLSKVRNEYLVQQMKGSLFTLANNKLELIEGSQIFKGTDIRVILPYEENKYLIGTATDGIYIYDGTEFSIWNKSLSKTIESKELNCAILTSKGTYMLGTILDGIYEVNKQGQILNHMSAANSLQNNTILSLYEDNQQNIWVAMDRGVAYIHYIENMDCYTIPRGNTPAIYDAIRWEEKLILATNQGVFYLNEKDLDQPNTLDKIKLIEGSQGQAWKLYTIDDKLYCGHNRGLKQIHPNMSINDEFSIGTGVYNISENEINNEKRIILSTYSSIRIIDPLTKKVSIIDKIQEPIITTITDHLDNVWLEHFNKGVYRCRLNKEQTNIESFTHYGGDNNDGLPYKLKIFKVGGRIVLLGDNEFFTYDDIENRIIPNKLLNECFENINDIRNIVPISNDEFWALGNTSIYKFKYNGYEASIIENYTFDISLSLVNNYENASQLSEDNTLICLDNGFLIYKKPTKGYYNKSKKLNAPFIEVLQTSNIEGHKKYENLKENAEISNTYNTVTFHFSTENIFASDISFQYKLNQVDPDWSTNQKINKISYARLSAGKYTFMLRTVDKLGNTSEPIIYNFEILSPWYLTGWAYLGYLILFVFIFYSVWILILRRYRNLHLQKIRARETKRLRNLAGKLQNELEIKNAELLTQTSFIIQKNELIIRIKDIIENFQKSKGNKSLEPLIQKINQLLNNVDSENDWKTFLIKFEEKHKNFFKKLKTLYPQLTSSDLRLCACLKLNLESKEIASLMNLSVRAVENSRYRLRKKLELKPSQNLNEFILNLE